MKGEIYEEWRPIKDYEGLYESGYIWKYEEEDKI